jgi:hypothetical protein
MHPPTLPTKEPERRRSRRSPKENAATWADLIAFLAVLATGVILIIFGHMTAGSLTSACAALVAVYGAWRRLR